MLEDNVFVVVGGGHGIGKATAIHLGELGASVVVNDIGTDLRGDGESAEPAKQVAERTRAAGGEAMAHFGDISSLEYTEELIADTVEAYGRVDGVVNFAGVLAAAPAVSAAAPSAPVVRMKSRREESPPSRRCCSFRQVSWSLVLGCTVTQTGTIRNQL
jgi:NAD(P)-dependent dehydrogenase (short-subunit alcohol dehydrogenase family)